MSDVVCTNLLKRNFAHPWSHYTEYKLYWVTTIHSPSRSDFYCKLCSLNALNALIDNCCLNGIEPLYILPLGRAKWNGKFECIEILFTCSSWVVIVIEICRSHVKWSLYRRNFGMCHLKIKTSLFYVNDHWSLKGNENCNEFERIVMSLSISSITTITN